MMPHTTNQSNFTPSKAQLWEGQSVDNRNSILVPTSHRYTQSPLSDDLDKDLLLQFQSFQHIDDLVQKQEELYNQITKYQLQTTIPIHDPQQQQNIPVVQQQQKVQSMKMQQRKTRNLTQSGTAPYPYTVGSIHDNNHSVSQTSNPVELTITHQPLLNSMSSADPAFSHLKQRSDNVMDPVYQSHDNSLNFYQMQQQEYQQKMTQSMSSLQLKKNKPLQVTERLLTIGKMYEAKRQHLKEQYENVKKNQEDQIVSHLKRKYSRENLHQTFDSGKPVEQRLHDMKRKYDQRALDLKTQIHTQELQQLKNPQINSKSQKIVQNQSYSSLKVEDRLLEVGKKWKEKKEKSIQNYFQDVDSRSYPVLTLSQRDSKLSNVQPKKSAKLLKTFEQRLKDQMEKKEKMLQELKKKYDGAVQTTQTIADKRFQLERTNQFKVVYLEQSKCPFKPQINENSKKIAASTSRERLTAPGKHTQCKIDRFSKSPSQKSMSRKDSQISNLTQDNIQSNVQRGRSRTPNHNKQEPQFTFHPTINERSKQLAMKQLMISLKEGVQQDGNDQAYDGQTEDNIRESMASGIGKSSVMMANEPRWKLLYGKYVEISQHKEEIKKKHKEIQEQKEQENCTFHPQIQDTNFVYQSMGQLGEVVERNHVWHQQRQQSTYLTFQTPTELQYLNELNKKEEVDGCTFKPQIIKTDLNEALQADYSQLNTKAIEKFLERCNYAKQLKVERELLEEAKFGSGAKWKNKVTHAKAPSFMKGYYDNIKQSNPSPIKHPSIMKSAKVQPNRDLAGQMLHFHTKSNSKTFSVIHEANEIISQIQSTTDVHHSKLNHQDAAKPYVLTDHVLNQLDLQQQFTFQEHSQQQLPYTDSLLNLNANNSIQDTSKQTYTAAVADDDKEDFQNALNFLHEQLHKIEFSFDQHQ